MAHYRSRGRLHMADRRDQAVEHAVREWARLTETNPIYEVALISDGSGWAQDAGLSFRGGARDGDPEEPDRARAHHEKVLDRRREPRPSVQNAGERVENGSQGEVLDVTPAGEVLVEFDVPQAERPQLESA